MSKEQKQVTPEKVSRFSENKILFDNDSFYFETTKQNMYVCDFDDIYNILSAFERAYIKYCSYDTFINTNFNQNEIDFIRINSHGLLSDFHSISEVYDYIKRNKINSENSNDLYFAIYFKDIRTV